MIAALLLGVVIGSALASVVALVLRRNRIRDLNEVLDRVDGDEPSATDNADASLVRRVPRVIAGLEERRDRAVTAVERLEQALDRVVEGIVVCDADGAVVFTNRAGLVLADARHEDALVAASVADGLRSALAGEAATRSVELFGPPSRTITVDAQPLGPLDRPIGAVSTIADESRLRRLEAVRSDFVANVSHELKTPIGGLAVLADALSDSDDPAERERLSDRLLHEALRVGRVVDDLLSLSEIEGDLAPRRERVAVAELIRRMQAEVAVLADGFGIAVDVSAVADDLAVVGDVVQLTSAVANLVENAIKYSGGASPVVVSGELDGRFVRLSVRDRGIGIPRRDLDRVFERFYRVDQARSRATGGTGLGLAIVRNIVRSHDGEVELTSREGAGTTVTIRLPVAVSASALDDPVEHPA